MPGFPGHLPDCTCPLCMRGKENFADNMHNPGNSILPDSIPGLPEKCPECGQINGHSLTCPKRFD